MFVKTFQFYPILIPPTLPGIPYRPTQSVEGGIFSTDPSLNSVVDCSNYFNVWPHFLVSTRNTGIRTNWKENHLLRSIFPRAGLPSHYLPKHLLIVITSSPPSEFPDPFCFHDFLRKWKTRLQWSLRHYDSIFDAKLLLFSSAQLRDSCWSVRAGKAVSSTSDMRPGDEERGGDRLVLIQSIARI